MTWLVTGGAGYIGSHVVRSLMEKNIDCVVIDDLSSGHREFVDDSTPFVEGNLLDRALVDEVLSRYFIKGVMHIAGFKYAGVSVQQPLHTYDQNVTAMVTLLKAMADAKVNKIVFSSSAAVYGTPATGLVTEASPTSPESPYGESKLIGEWLLRDQHRAAGVAHTSLRYFNVVGSGYDDLYDTSPHNLFPLIFESLIAGRTPRINGDSYPTPDGTCIRDYVHVQDLATSHTEAAQALDAGRSLEQVYNLGSGAGVSVRQIMDAVSRVTGIAFTPEVRPARPGDPAQIVAAGALAERDLDWRMRHTLDEMVSSAWEARQAAGQP